MRKVVLLMHTSLDGFVAGEDGELDWVRIDDEINAHVDHLLETVDNAIYGRVTYGMMRDYEHPARTPPAPLVRDGFMRKLSEGQAFPGSGW